MLKNTMTLNYEECLYKDTYNFIKGFSNGRKLKYLPKALALAELVHKGQYRKGTVIVNNEEVKVPYFLHVLKVTDALIALDLPMSNEELDILLTSAILHDVVEDAPEGFFKHDGTEIVTDYGFPSAVYEVICLLSKRSGASEAELDIYFNAIKKNKYALLIKMADRSHNVEDLYNMKPEKLHKYVEETRRWVYPLSTYAKKYYPEFSNGVTLLKSKIVTNTENTETIIAMYEEKVAKKDEEIAQLRKQIEKLQLEKKLRNEK